jgi:tRNA(His) 5'-end guanylyltransferase
MQFTALKLCESIQNCKIGYTQSDEITLILTDFENRETESWFGGNLQKIVSVSAAIATAEFNKHWLLKSIAGSWGATTDYSDVCNLISDMKSAHFDSRVYTVSDAWEAFNSLYWRELDASKNSIQMVAHSLYSHKELQNKNTIHLHDMIHEKDQNWNDYPTDCKRGAFIVKDETGWIIDREGPILSQDKEYFFSRVPQIEGYSKI